MNQEQSPKYQRAVRLCRILYLLRYRFLPCDHITASIWKERERKLRSQAAEIKSYSQGSGSAAYTQPCVSKCAVDANRHVCTAQRSVQFSARHKHGGLHYSTGVAGGTSEVAFWQERNCVRQNHDGNWKWALCWPPKWNQLHYGLGNPDDSCLWSLQVEQQQEIIWCCLGQYAYTKCEREIPNAGFKWSNTGEKMMTVGVS